MVARLFFILSFWVSAGVANAQANVTTNTDLSLDWKVFRDGEFKLINADDAFKAIHLQILPSQQHSYLFIKGKYPIWLFLNGKILKNVPKEGAKIRIDSLTRLYGIQILFSIYSTRIVTKSTLITELLPTQERVKQVNLEARVKDGFSDFFIVAAILIIAGFLMLLRANTRLMLDYLNPIKAFSLRERESDLNTNRITSSINILFYVFTSYLIAFLCFAWFHCFTYKPNFYASIQTFTEVFLKWNLLAAMLFILLVFKFILISLFSYIFRLKGSLHLHFYNFIRTLLLLSVAILGLTIVIFILHDSQAKYLNGCSFIIGLFGFSWLMVAYLKLLTNSAFSFLHLFFYLCTTEIIPLIILVKFIS